MTERNEDARAALATALCEHELFRGWVDTDLAVADLIAGVLTERGWVVRPADEVPPGYVREEDVIVWASVDGRLHCSTLARERNAAMDRAERSEALVADADVSRERMRAALADRAHERDEARAAVERLREPAERIRRLHAEGNDGSEWWSAINDLCAAFAAATPERIAAVNKAFAQQLGDALIEEADPYACCRAAVPSAGGDRQEGERWTCPTCGRVWGHWVEEAEGAGWGLVTEEADRARSWAQRAGEATARAEAAETALERAEQHARDLWEDEFEGSPSVEDVRDLVVRSQRLVARVAARAEAAERDRDRLHREVIAILGSGDPGEAWDRLYDMAQRLGIDARTLATGDTAARAEPVPSHRHYAAGYPPVRCEGQGEVCRQAARAEAEAAADLAAALAAKADPDPDPYRVPLADVGRRLGLRGEDVREEADRG
jgi:hypothetical protein